MEQKKIEHITLHLIVFGTIVIIGVLARQTVLHGIGLHAQADGGGGSCQSVFYIMQAGHMEGHVGK